MNPTVVSRRTSSPFGNLSASSARAVTAPSVRLAVKVGAAFLRARRTLDGSRRHEADLSDSRHLAQRVLGRAAHRPLLDAPEEEYHSVRAVNPDGAAAGDGIGHQHGPRLGGEAQVPHREAGGFGGLKARVLQGLLHEPGSFLRLEPIGIDHQVVEKWVLQVDMVEEPHAAGALAIRLPDAVERIGEIEPLGLGHAFGTAPFRRGDASPQRVGRSGQNDGGRQAHQHDVVVGRHLLNGGLDVLREPPLGGAEAVDESGPLLDRVAQTTCVFAEAIRRLADDVPLGELVAEPRSQGMTDLDPQTAHVLRDGDDAHRAPPGLGQQSPLATSVAARAFFRGLVQNSQAGTTER